LLVALVAAVVPQNSADRVTWWRNLCSHREKMAKRANRKRKRCKGHPRPAK